ncbi:tRNA adenosine(34) deaminase TadA [Gottschalkiaceae bacterium SANA]|nr:tRNA adenosine(34) deaminase TadA [Gottschalkiaceae bacterium SANA]
MIEDEKWMAFALNLAKEAMEEEEVPVGAVIVRDGEVVGQGRNQKEMGKNPLYHAEIMAIDEACKALGGWRLVGCTMYVTLEPCPMCAGAIISARLPRLVIGADDPKMGGCGSVVNICQNEGFNHEVAITRGVLADESTELLQTFFQGLRLRMKEKAKKRKEAAQ